MNRLLFIFALTGILLQNFSKIYTLLEFQVNREYIAKNLCVKKNEVNNCCKGKCHLQKQLAEDDKKLPSSDNSTKEKAETEQITHDHPALNLQAYAAVSTINTRYVCMVPKHLPGSLFHPPPAIRFF